jgi:hypothetical protein
MLLREEKTRGITLRHLAEILVRNEYSEDSEISNEKISVN